MIWFWLYAFSCVVALPFMVRGAGKAYARKEEWTLIWSRERTKQVFDTPAVVFIVLMLSIIWPLQLVVSGLERVFRSGIRAAEKQAQLDAELKTVEQDVKKLFEKDSK